MAAWNDATFSCGLLGLGGQFVDDEPDWGDFKERIDFVREVRGLHATFLTAFKDEKGQWEVPFFSAQVEAGAQASPKALLERDTPYKVWEFKSLKPAELDPETLRVLQGLASDDVRSSWIDDVVPAAHPRFESPEMAFDGLVGMEAQRERLMKLARVVKTCGRDAIECFHFVFVGNPGTGKTELAMRMSSYLDLIGVTDGTGRFVKVGEADLVAKYVGHTAPKVKAVVESALGGVLFVDEFYALANAPHFGQEAIDCLTDQLDYHRHDLVCVIAGYPDEVDRTLALNPGLRDRMGYRVEFPDYTTDELRQIFCTMAEGRGFVPRCERGLARALDELRDRPDFSNARSVRRLLDHAVCEACWNHDGREILDEDVLVAASQCTAGGGCQRIGF